MLVRQRPLSASNLTTCSDKKQSVRSACCCQPCSSPRRWQVDQLRFQGVTTQTLGTALTVFASLELASATAASAAATGYAPGPVQVGWQTWTGAAAAAFPFVFATWEFGKRILIQRRCAACQGTGLVERAKKLRKCKECGGFLPWLGWKQFFQSTASPGNGGPLRQPKGQTSVIYKVPSREADGSSDDRLEASEK